MIGSLQTFEKPQAVVAYSDKFSQIAGEGAGSVPGQGSQYIQCLEKVQAGGLPSNQGWLEHFRHIVAYLRSLGRDKAPRVLIYLGLFVCFEEKQCFRYGLVA